VQVAAQLALLDQLRQLALACGLELTCVLAQLGRDVLVAEPLVDLLLALGREDLTALDLRDPVLRDREAAPLGVLP
jgi:hypothetical protein